MAIIKNLILFGGWIPTLLSGGGAVWWLTSDKTVEDALKRTNLVFLSKDEEFQNVYDEFKNDENFLKDIPNAIEKKGQAVKEWCEETLKKSLSDANAKDLVLEAAKYCMDNEKIVNNAKNFKQFESILDLLKGTNLQTQNMGGLIMALIGNNKNEDVYFALTSESDLSKDAWRLDPKISRSSAFGEYLFIDGDKKILSFSGDNDKWIKKGEEYDKDDNTLKFPDLNKATYLVQGTNRDGTRGSYNTSLLITACRKALIRSYDDKEKLENTKKLFIKWCTE